MVIAVVKRLMNWEFKNGMLQYNNTRTMDQDNGMVQYNTIIILKSNFIQNREYIPYKSLKKA